MLKKKKSAGDKIISTKIPLEEYTRFMYYCETTGETLNASLKRLILSALRDPKPSRIAGKSIFEYDKSKDNFAWNISLDNGAVITIDSNLPASSVEQLFLSLKKAYSERNSFLGKNKKDSVTFPRKLLRNKR